MLKKYQPGRLDLLINTDWGIAGDALTPRDAQDRSLLLFHERWVTKEEMRQLKDERNAYISVRIFGFVLMALALLPVINLGAIYKSGIVFAILAVVYSAVLAAGGVGLVRYARPAQYLALLIFISFLILPFTPLFADDKGAPFMVFLGLTGLYYLLRKTARKIFRPLNRPESAHPNKQPVVRKIVYGIALLIVLWAGYFVYDLRQARQLSANACRLATPGMPLEAYLSKFPGQDYKIIRRPECAIIIPKRNLGRNHCTVMHDGRIITGAQTGFTD